MPIKVFWGDGRNGCWPSDVATGIYYAADHNAGVINMSLGGGGG